MKSKLSFLVKCGVPFFKIIIKILTTKHVNVAWRKNTVCLMGYLDKLGLRFVVFNTYYFGEGGGGILRVRYILSDGLLRQ